jgi:hypothetical protein
LLRQDKWKGEFIVKGSWPLQLQLRGRFLKAYSAELGQLTLFVKSEAIYSFIRTAYHGRLSFLTLTCSLFRPSICNTEQQIKKKVCVMNMLLIYLFASMKLEKGHKNYLALVLTLFYHNYDILRNRLKCYKERWIK